MATISVKHVDDISTCPICIDVLTDSRVLPCIHTFCLKCLDGYAKGRKPGTKLPCPMCRKEFVIPTNGLSELPRNFFVDRLLEVTKLSVMGVESVIPCDLCSNGVAGKTSDVVPATMFCVVCQEKYCASCSEYHRKMKMSSGHKQVDISNHSHDAETVGELIKKLSVSMCDKHAEEKLKLYCMECKAAMCVLCYIKQHNSHKCADVGEVHEELNKQIGTDSDAAEKGISGCDDMLEKLAKEKTHFVQEVNEVQDQICAAAEQLKKLVDQHKQQLIDELNESRDKRIKQIDTVKEEVEFHLTALRSFVRYSKELREKGTACDVTRAASGLRERAKELMTVDVVRLVTTASRPIDVIFRHSEIFTGAHASSTKNVVGAVDVLEKLTSLQTSVPPQQLQTSFERDVVTELPCTPDLRQAIDVGTEVTGVTCQGDEIFVLLCTSRSVNVYDQQNFQLRRTIQIPNAGSGLFGLASCAANVCLYVSDYYNRVVHRISLSASSTAISCWKTKYVNPTGLSVNSANNLIVSNDCQKSLLEYTTSGKLVREITNVKSSYWHSLQTSTDQFLVSQGNVLQLFNVDGSCIGKSTCLNDPAGLAIDKQGHVIVADRVNNRIVVLDKSLSRSGVFPLPPGCTLCVPWSVYLDESRDRLYVGEYNGNRLLVFDNVRNIGNVVGI